jgi:hypothetical protein
MTNPDPVVVWFHAEADDFLDQIIEKVRVDHADDPLTTAELTDYLMDQFWSLAIRYAEDSDDPDDHPDRWAPLLITTVLSTAIQRLAALDRGQQ